MGNNEPAVDQSDLRIRSSYGLTCSILYILVLFSCHFYAIPIIPFLIYKIFHLLVLLQVNEKFHKLERGYRDCIKRTRDKTRIYSILHDAPGA